MKLTAILCRQHIGFMFKRHWLVQGKRVPVDTGVEKHLKSLGIEVIDANEYVKEPEEVKEKVEVIGMLQEPLPLDRNHPDYKERELLKLGFNNVLLEGINQAQVLTNTIRIDNKLPEPIENGVEIPSTMHEYVKNSILNACVYDAEQKNLPKIKDPVRPAYNFPRILGITDKRRNTILTNKLVNLLERINTDKPKLVANNVESIFTTEKDGDFIQFETLSNILLASENRLNYSVTTSNAIDLPDLSPIKHTVTLSKQHFYTNESIYPLNKKIKQRLPHTTWLHYNPTEVANIYETPVTDSQIYGRSLMHCFTVGSAFARDIYEDINDLPVPLYLNCIQTDGRLFHLGVLQLNTLNMNSTGTARNYWFSINNLKLYNRCEYVKGAVILEGYNDKLVNYLNAMYCQ